jgi:ATP-dependent Clp protease ATP-binding subunit ClpA
MSEIDSIILKSVDLAKRLRHEYVTVEHLSVIVLDDVGIRAMCYEIQADCLGIQEAITSYLEEDCTELIVKHDNDFEPRKTMMLERVFNRALTQALFANSNKISQIDLVLSILSEHNSAACKFSNELGLERASVEQWLIDTSDIDHDQDHDPTDPRNYLTEKERAEMEDYASQMYQNLANQMQTKRQTNNVSDQQSVASPRNIRQAHEVLEQFTVNMNIKSEDFDDIIGRRQELRDLVQSLARKKKSNAILVGPSGVGKTAIVEGLAKLVVEGNVPETIQEKTILSLDMSKMVAGTKYRGDFEERMKKLVEALEIVDDIILFIDEIHMVIGAGSTGSGQMDAGNMLKPALTGGKLKVIGATTDEEYRKIFEKEAALARRFTKISVDEPTVDEAKKILRNTIMSYEVHYGCEITGEACDLAVDLSNDYVFNKKLPDKAFDVVDRACAYNKIMPSEERLETISANQIREEVSRYTGIPAEHLGAKAENQTVKKHGEVADYLYGTVFGQDHAIERVVDSITVSLAGLKDPNKPVASYLFTGPTGVGKTELAKRLSSAMGMKLVRYDMAEFQERHTVSKLIGSPPGYVGHGDGKAGDGMLITNLEDTPNCVLLLDEVEKAHPDIMTVLLALLDDGVITSSTGKKVSGKNCIIIMTSNLGAREGNVKSIGFGEETFNSRAVDEAINKFFAPEFRNRLDGIVRFNSLQPQNITRIVDKFLHQIEGYVASRHMKIVWSDEMKSYLEKNGYDPAMGARPLARLINEKVKLPLAKFMMSEKDLHGMEINIHWNGEETIVSTVLKEITDG